VTAVRVVAPFQVSHDGQIFRAGKTADVPDELASFWARRSWVELVDGQPEAATKKTAPKPASKFVTNPTVVTQSRRGPGSKR
jgi:hypothetical protein